MSDPNFTPVLLCQSCKHPIPLPPATHPDTSLGLKSWPTDGALRNFSCPACRSVFEYSAKDVQPFPIQKLPESRPRSVAVILLPCGVSGCASLLRIHTLMGNDAELRQAGPEVAARSIAHAIRCDTGHTLTGLPKMGGAIRTQFDPDWERQT